MGRDERLIIDMLSQVRAGHGAGKPTSKIIEEAADSMAFAAAAMRASWHT